MYFSRTFLFLCIFLFVFTSFVHAQTPAQKRNITKDYNQKNLSALADDFKEKLNTGKQNAFLYADKHNLPKITHHEGLKSRAFLRKIDKNGNLFYIKTHNVYAAATTGADKLYPGGEMGLELTGEGMKIAVWDGGKVRETHELLEGKVTNKDEVDYDDHATHTSGTMVGKDLSAEESEDGYMARGMAYEATIDAYDMQNDLPNMVTAAADGLLISNHSYGYFALFLPEYQFGRYDEESASIDALAYEAPYYTMVAAAGNDRLTLWGTPVDDPYNLLTGAFGTAKNPIVIAAVQKVEEYHGPSSVKMSTFSSWGPTKDNRIKPDLSADGVEVFSSIAFIGANPIFGGGTPSDVGYESYSGTSMASPNAAGSLLLLQQLSSELNDGNFMKAATLKAIAIHTALQADEIPGPNPRSGWGLLNLKGAAQLMIDNHEENGDFYEELLLNTETASYTQTIQAAGNTALKATIAWTDPAAEEHDEQDNSSRLINDLDLRIYDSQGNEFFPWRLDPADVEAPALKDADNSIDNVEQVIVDFPTAGAEYTIEVTHKGELVNAEQYFSIAVTGIGSTMNVEAEKANNFNIYPNPAKDFVFLNLQNTAYPININLIDLSGKVLVSKNLKNADQTQMGLDVSDLNSGVYFIKIITGEKSFTEKLIIR